MHVTFVYPDFQVSSMQGWMGSYYQGIGSLSASLKKDSHTTSLFHVYDKTFTKKQFLEHISQNKPNLIAFSFTTFGFEFVKKCLLWLQESENKIPIVCGGIHPTLMPDEVIAEDGVNILCIGEGELPLKELCENLQEGRDISSIQNLWVKKEGKVQKNSLRPLISNLDILPDPDREIFDFKNLEKEKEGGTIFMASRGCPYKCAYCANASLHKTYDNAKGYVRFRSVDSVISEIQSVLSKHSFIKMLTFDDDILFLKKDWAKEFSIKYKEKIGLPFTCNIHPLLIDDFSLNLLSEAGCSELKVGIESGSEFIRTKILKRKFSNRRLLNAILQAKSKGIYVNSFNMVGLPFEDPKMALETIKINALGGSDQTQVSIFYPFPNTPLYTLCRDENFISKVIETFDDYYSGSALTMETFKKEHIVSFRNYFQMLMKIYKIIYKLPYPLSRISEIMFDRICCSKKFPEYANFVLEPIRLFYQKNIK